MGKNSQSYIGYIEVFPSKTIPKSTTSTSSNTNIGMRQLTQSSNEVERITKSVFKDAFVACCNQFSRKQRAEVFVEKGTGRTGFKQEVTYKSTASFYDKFHGSSNHCETQVKHKKVTFPRQSGAKPALPKAKGYGGSTSNSKNYGPPKSSAKGGKSYYY